VGELTAQEQAISALGMQVQELTVQVQELTGKLSACYEKFGQLRRHWGVRVLSLFQKGLLDL
jgi:uncharacterized coiled-coil protein SlyX